jgi:hypothetical protein
MVLLVPDIPKLSDAVMLSMYTQYRYYSKESIWANSFFAAAL